ncbi:MAG: EF-P beta-lysylation protein EpmB [Gammaproteobacteria bacterium]|nr:EF-P beta-lysylation protein EpmB [Gammaproteobacteria bacterium]
MIARTPLTWQSDGWQQELAAGFRRPHELLTAIGIAPGQIATGIDSDSAFSMRVPRAYARRMRRGDPADPLLRQVLPLADERQPAPGFTADPVGDHAARRGAGVLHKYRGRALLITTGACAIHCRYCFRRHFPYTEAHAADNEWEDAVNIIAGDASLREVILSGGDPLSLTTSRLARLVHKLEAIPHLARLRLHTRLPIVLPSRIEDGLIELLARGRLKPVMVVHANHPNEIDDEVRAALARLADTGIALFNQSVLLRGVNDDAMVLTELSEALFEAGVTPYYLHQLDRVQGAAHFEVDIDTARTLHRQLRENLPGYLVPQLVQEVAGEPFKRPV